MRLLDAAVRAEHRRRIKAKKSQPILSPEQRRRLRSSILVNYRGLQRVIL